MSPIVLPSRAVASIRQARVEQLIQEELSMIFQRNAKTHFGGLFITPTVVRISPDLGSARVYLSIMDKVEKPVVIREMNGRAKMIRGMLGESVGKQLRKVPELHFFLDDSLDYSQRIDDLLN